MGSPNRRFLTWYLDVGQNQGYHFGLGAQSILVHFSGDWDVHWGYGLLTRSRIEAGKGGLLSAGVPQGYQDARKPAEAHEARGAGAWVARARVLLGFLFSRPQKGTLKRESPTLFGKGNQAKSPTGV